jgi:hypothetical protein
MKLSTISFLPFSAAEVETADADIKDKITDAINNKKRQLFLFMV